MKTTFSPRDAVPKPEERQFPIIIQGKGPKVTVYEDDDRGKPVYIVVYYAEGTRQRLPQRDFAVAFKLAQQMALELGNGWHDALPLMGKERRVYEHALELLPSDMELGQVLAEAVDIRKRLNGAGSPVEAVE